MKLKRALTKTAAIAIAVAIIIVAAVGVYFATTQRGVTTPTPTPTTQTPTITTPTTPIQTTPTTTTTPVSPTTYTPPTTTTPTATQTTPTSAALAVLTIGNIQIRVPQEFYDFAMKAKRGEVSVTINFWTSMMDFELKAIKQVIDMFQREYPGIKVNHNNVQGMKERVTASVAVGDVDNGPYVFTWAHDWTGLLADGGYIVALDDYLPRETIEDIQGNLLSVAYSAATYKLRLYGLPWAAEAIALVCNRKYVQQIPATWDELEQLMKSFYKPDEGRYGIAYQIDPYHIYPFITLFGGFYYDETTNRHGFLKSETAEGYKFLIEHVYPYMYMGDLGHEAQLKLFLDEKAPCIITGPWNIPAIREAFGENIVVGPIPPYGSYVPKPFVGVKLLWITPLAAQKGREALYASLLFALWFSMNDEALKVLVDTAGFIPVKLSLVDYVMSNKDKYQVVSGFLQSVRNGVAMPKDPNMDAVWGEAANALNAFNTEYINNGANVALSKLPDLLRTASDNLAKRGINPA